MRGACCQEIIGACEPARVLLHDGTELKSSLALREQLETHGSVALHVDCYDPFVQGQEQGGAGAAD